MSRYAYLTCVECGVALWLGKAIYKGNRVDRFHMGQESDPANSLNNKLNRVIWKFLADHAGHAIRVIVEGDADFDSIGDYQEIGGDEIVSISIDDYLSGWTG